MICVSGAPTSSLDIVLMGVWAHIAMDRYVTRVSLRSIILCLPFSQRGKQAVGVAAFTMLLYDHLITFSDEVCYNAHFFRSSIHVYMPRWSIFGKERKDPVRASAHVD